MSWREEHKTAENEILSGIPQMRAQVGFGEECVHQGSGSQGKVYGKGWQPGTLECKFWPHPVQAL